MDSGPNPADQIFYARRPISNSPLQHQNQNQHHPPSNNQHPEPPQLRLQQHPYAYDYEPPPLLSSDARSPQPQSQPQLPPKLPFLTTANLHAAAANGYADGLTSTGGGDPAEFYRDYRGVQQSSNGYTDTTGTTNGMATTDSRPVPSSLRSNGNGNTPKHPSIPPRGIKNSYRSASSPLDERMTLNNAKSSPQLNGIPRNISVKDMLKKFDQNLESSTARKPTPGASTPGYMRDRTGYVGRTTGNSQNTSSTSRGGMSTREPAGRKSPEKTRTTQRPRFATEDQHSNNTLSGVPRSTRPRNSVSGNSSQASKSMTNLSPTSPVSNSSQAPARRPLFGEVLPIGPGLDDIGYGIPNTATRRTSDSNLHPSWQRQRSRSEVEVSPSSPTAWYLGVTPALDDVDPNKPRSLHGHNRNHSDFQDTKANTMNGVNPAFETPAVPSLPKPPTTQTSQSRLPISSKRRSNSSESSSPTSTRASSPFTAKPYSNVKLRKSEQRHWSPATRDSTNRSNTPTQTRGKARKPEPAPTGTVLAHITSPPLHASPPLRGSRTRQPVSSASTSSSRQKAVDRAGSPQHVRTGMKVTRNNGPPGFDHPPPRTIADTTPVDWEAQKTKIRRAYTKSIHESEQRQIRADNLRRLNDRTARDSLEGKESSATQQRPETPPPPVPVIDPQVNLKSPPQAIQTSPALQPAPLQVKTTFFKDDHSPLERTKMTFEDSPTLGMPGTFIVDDEEPPSAISNATGITEIENEPQTEAARLRRLPSTKRKEPSRLSSNVISWSDDLSPEQALYGIAHDDSISVKLASAPVGKAEPTPTEDVRDPLPPGAFQEDPDDQPVFATTLTSASPEKTSPASSIHLTSFPIRSFESGDEQGSNNVELPKDATPPAEVIPELQNPPEITFPDEGGYSETPEFTDGPRLQLPDLRTALAPPSNASDAGGTDYLNTPVTDMDYDSSDGAGATHRSDQDIYQAPYETTRDPVPSSRGNRSSRQSSWTDYSLDSQGYSEHDDHRKPPPVTISDTEQSSRQRSQSPTPPVPPKPEGYSPLPSPGFPATSQITSPNHHQLPPLTTGEGFGFGFAEQTLPLWPNHSPPPIPDQSNEASPIVPSRTPPLPGQQNRRPPSSIDQSSHNDASQHPESRRPSDDLYSPRPSVSTPRSSTQISFEDAVKEVIAAPKLPGLETEEERAAARVREKELTKRKRQLMELIDTESVYLKDMNVVEEIYKGTAEACPKVEIGDVKIIFRNTDKIVAFTTMFLDELRSAVASVYTPRTPKHRGSKVGTPTATGSDRFSVAATLNDDQTLEEKDQRTIVGACFNKNLKEMSSIYTDYLKNSEAASSRLATLMTDNAVKVWLNECNTVAKDLTSAWDIDSLLVKPFQRICRYQLFLQELLQTTPPNHPDMPALAVATSECSSMIGNINDMKRRVKMVGEIVKGRKRKESNVRQGIGKVFGQKSAKREKDEKQDQPAITRGEEDPEYLALHEKYSENFMRMQVVLRDVQFHLRQCISYVETDLKYKSAMELVMRLSASPWPELESKWARFNMSMRDMGTVALDQHTAALQTQVIEPFEKLIQLYGPPGLAMKKRSKRRADYEKILAAKKSGSKITEKDQNKLDQYEALNETLKSELPMLFEKTEAVANLLLGHLVVINTRWYDVWQRKVSVVLEEKDIPKTLDDIVVTFNREYEFVERETQKLGIVNGSINTTLDRGLSTGKPSTDTSDARSRRDTEIKKGRPSDLSSRSRGLSVNSDRSPSLPTPDFAKRLSGSQFTFSPITSTTPNVPQFAYQNQPYSTGHSRAGSGSPATPDPRTYGQNPGRPSTSRSQTSDSDAMRTSNDYNTQHRRESGSTYNSHVDGPPTSTRPYSGIFHSAMPLPDGPEDSARSSRASSRDRNVSSGYNVLYLAASLFEFNIEATKSEAGYPYLTYQAGEIFDVIGEKGELWLAKNQDDPSDQVGWIWSKHFARLASD